MTRLGADRRRQNCAVGRLPQRVLCPGDYRLGQVARFLQVLVDSVCHHLGIGFGSEPMSLCFQFFAQGMIVLDDTVVHDNDGLVTDVGMRILFTGFTMGRPASVTDPDRRTMLRFFHSPGQFSHSLVILGGTKPDYRPLPEKEDRTPIGQKNPSK